MPRKPVNPLIKLANVMSEEVDKFAARYDDAIDKKEFVRNIGDLQTLTENQKGMYANITNAVGITDDIYNDTFIHLFRNHSHQGGINRQGDSSRIYAMADYLVQTYVDVSCALSVNLSYIFMPDIEIYKLIHSTFQHLDSTGDV